MTDKAINKLTLIQDNINKLSINSPIKPQIICVSKTFALDKLKPLIDHGHMHYGENKVQEATTKWKDLKQNNSNLKLHMVGKLQSNKAQKAVEIFDYIHSLDNAKLADILKKRENEFNKKLSYFIQLNIGNESQKSGISKNEVGDYSNYFVKELNLNIIGLMVLPPNDSKTEKYFEETKNLNAELGLKHLSMGMSEDYELAIKFKSTFLRIGSGILGPRSINK